jgi:hypothetical protein
MRLAGTVVVVSVLIASGSAAVVQPASSQTPEGIAEAFLVSVGKGEIGPAYERLFARSPLAPQSVQVDTLRRQTEAFLPIHGKVLGFELYKQDKFGDSLLRVVYVQRLEKHPMIWKFWFYRPAGEWQVNGVTFNDQFNFE